MSPDFNEMTPEQKLDTVMRQLKVVSDDFENEQRRRRQLHVQYLEDMDRWAEREQWLQDQIVEASKSAETGEEVTHDGAPAEGP